MANAIFDGSDAIMLSGETAAGLYPVEAVQTMYDIAITTEAALNPKDVLSNLSKNSDLNMAEAICQSAAHTAINLDVNAIVTPTESGHTPRMISKYRPKAPIVAVTSNEAVLRRLSLAWGVYPQLGQKVTSTDEMLEHAVAESLNTTLAKRGDLFIIIGGVPVGEPGTTNMMKVHVVGDVLIKGQGVGRKSAHGKAVIVKNAREANEKIKEGSVMVAIGTDKEMVPALEKCSALITEEGGLTSHAAIVGLSLGIPVIVGIENATTLIKDGQELTVDATRGIIYNGHASVL